jgi:glycosidase
MITYYFHVSKDSRIKYQFDENLFSLQGDLIIKDFKTARLLADKINQVRLQEGKTNELVTAGQLNALGLLHEIFHLMIRKYESNENPGVFQRSIEFLRNSMSEEELENTMLKFIEEFPPLPVYKNEVTAKEYLNSNTENKSNREIILEEIILLNIENINPATYQLKELYSDEKLSKETSYKILIENTEKFFEVEKPVSSAGVNLISFLKKPIITNPYNIDLQLDFIKENWKDFVGEDYFIKILSGKDLIYEDSKIFVKHGGGEKGTPPVPKYEFDIKYFEEIKSKIDEGKKVSPEEYEYYQLEIKKFTPDVEWMPNVVMIAKNTFVWLDQLSKKYKREIKRLNQIPDEELDQLARWNFNALWLIGIWERSSASQKIKQMTGNPDAAPSAYSLYDYVIAKELGGEEAFQILKHKCWQRGIRLSSDMVPNHTGIFSKWVIEKPEYFIQTNYPPFPVYKFTGPNLSEDPRYEIRIEDQYYNRTDAAVVFERIDRLTGERRYIYHGNDGTNMPWNDTAQLNLLLPEVRESLIQTIMHVAKKTPIIRFDAAMTLTKKHYQRLWFPIPGTGGAIPSRAEYGMTRSQFDEKMPNEFWREVVDRINNEMPDTLLLAEAFWLMEGYFVRSLGMHRVYNSAFMHMFMKEENSKYKELIKNTLLYDPEILKRYVNFMSNPDEETAVNQFGKGDKYFGVATMMVTMPGLPMFAHGQVEGFSEKYGMEYKRAYYNEAPDEHLIWKHIREIFPLMKKRYLFSQVNNFYLYDFIDSENEVDDNVFAYSNAYQDEKAFVIYNNSYYHTSGRVDYSCHKIVPNSYSTKNIRIAEALGFQNSSNHFYICKDFVKNDEFIFRGNDVWTFGLHFHLLGYERKVFLNFKEIVDYEGRYVKVYNHLQGKGVKSVEAVLKEIELEPLHFAMVKWLTSDEAMKFFEGEKVLELNLNSSKFLTELNKFNQVDTDSSKEKISESVEKIERFFEEFSEEENKDEINSRLIDIKKKKILKSHLLVYELLKLFKSENDPSLNIFDKYLLWKPLYEIFGYLGYTDETSLRYDILTLTYLLDNFDKIFNSYEEIKTKSKKKISFDEIKESFVEILEQDSVKNFIHYHTFENTEYFNKERFVFLLTNLLILWLFELFGTQNKKDFKKRFSFSELLIKNLFEAAEESQYKFKDLIDGLKQGTNK